jgi:endonuclease YncB( thermonuclease family)
MADKKESSCGGCLVIMVIFVVAGYRTLDSSDESAKREPRVRDRIEARESRHEPRIQHSESAPVAISTVPYSQSGRLKSSSTQPRPAHGQLGPDQEERSAREEGLDTSAKVSQVSLRSRELLSWSGECLEIIDGDTLLVKHGGHNHKIWLKGIESPELEQAYGAEAKKLAVERALGQEVKVSVVEIDTQGRAIAEVFLGDGRSLNALMLEEGLAWWCKDHSDDLNNLEELEQEARMARRGLWQDEAPLPPWEWRDNHSEGASTAPNSAFEAAGASIKGDSIKIGNELYEDVYIMESPAMYYVCILSTGEVTCEFKSKVDRNHVALVDDPVARDSLRERWRKVESNRREAKACIEQAVQREHEREIAERMRDVRERAERREVERLARKRAEREEESRRAQAEKQVQVGKSPTVQQSARLESPDREKTLDDVLKIPGKLDAQGAEMASEMMKGIAQPGYSIPQTEVDKWSSELDEMERSIRAHLKATNRKPGQPGYTLKERQELVYRKLLRQGYTSSEAALTVRDMTAEGILPDPPK